jgi:hypothetical protein
MADQSTNQGDPSPALPGNLPQGLTLSMITLGCSLAGILVCWNLRWPASQPVPLIVHASAALCLAWGLLAHGIHRMRPEGTTIPAGRDLVAVLQVTQLTLGLIVAVLMFYVAVMAVLMRIPSLPFFSYHPRVQVLVWGSGVYDLALIAAAALLAWRRTANGTLMTGLFWLFLLMWLWAALQIPETNVVVREGIAYPVLNDWLSPFLVGAAMTLAGFGVLAWLLAHRRRASAWPDRLSDLVDPAAEWPGFRYSAGVAAAMLLILGCILVVSPLTPIAALLAGASVLGLATRAWDENLADTGLGLITLAVVSLLMLSIPEAQPNRASYFAAVFSRAILGLAVMTAFWNWLARVWEQQLDNGEAWTTAGRLIRPCRRVAFILGATAVLVSAHLAFWPKLPWVDTTDNTLGRWVWGLVANVILLAVLVGVARRTGRPTMAWLASFVTACIGAFAVSRSTGLLYSMFFKYWPLMFASGAAACLVIARLTMHSHAWRAFFEPAYVLGVLVNPVVAIMGATFLASRIIPTWVDPATFGVLAGSFLLAAFLTGPRRFIVLTSVCALAAIWKLTSPS